MQRERRQRGTASAEPSPRFDAYRHFLAGRAEPRSATALPRLVSDALALVREAAPRLFGLVLGAQVAGALLLIVQVVAGKLALQRILEQADEGSFGPVVAPLAVVIAATAAAGFVTAAQTHLRRVLGERVERLSLGRVLDVTSRVDLVEFERPEFFDDLQRVKVNASVRPLALVTGLTQVVGGALAAGALVVALFVLQPLLVPLLLAAALPMWLLSRASGRLEFAFVMRQTHERRVRNYLEQVLTGREEAKEVRAFALGGAIAGRWRDSFTAYFGELDAHVRRRLRLDLGAALVSALAMAATVGLLVWLIVDGRVALATAGAALFTVRLLGGRIQELSTGAGQLFESALFMRDLRTFLDRAGETDGDAVRAARPPAPRFDEVRAAGVSFRYPGSAADVLHDVSVSIGRGEVVALVGENGSGKTTLAKVLGQLLAPTGGVLEWNGRDARGFEPDSMRTQTGVIFQDFVRYQLTARENVGLGRADAAQSAGAIEDAARRGGAHDLLRELPEGYETSLGKEFMGGYDLSGGQWQRVALARAFFRDADLLILDEPTAALDARSEHEVFRHVAELAKGRALLLISHRFSTVRSADRIYVLDAGRVIEAGSHDELMAEGGRYAELFELQAGAYR